MTVVIRLGPSSRVNGALVAVNTNLTLLATCGSCTNDCTKQGPNAAWTCESDGDGSYQCVQHGCNDGWYECKADDGIQCETYCQATGSCEVTLPNGQTGCDANSECASGSCDLQSTPGPETGQLP